MKKRVLSVLLVMLLVFITACSNNEPQTSSGSEDAHLSIVTSFYPIYYLTKEIGGEHVKVTNLIPAGIEPHDWSPKSKDLLTASQADLLLYHGVGLETWIDNFKQGLEKDSGVLIKEVSTGINLIDVTAEEDNHADHDHATEEDHDHADHDHATEEEHDHADHDHATEEAHDHADHDHATEEADDHADHDHATEEADDHADHDHDHHHGGIDPHTWVSPKSALVLASNIKDSLVEADAEHAEIYEQNYEALKAKITALDEKYEEELSKVSLRTFVVSHQAFGYIARDYHLEQISIMGLSPSAEPRAQDIKNIANLVKEKGVRVIFFEELVSDNLAKMLAAEAKVDTNVIYSLEGLTTKQEQAGEDYLTLMERNLQNLVEALQ